MGRPPEGFGSGCCTREPRPLKSAVAPTCSPLLRLIRALSRHRANVESKAQSFPLAVTLSYAVEAQVVSALGCQGQAVDLACAAAGQAISPLVVVGEGVFG